MSFPFLYPCSIKPRFLGMAYKYFHAWILTISLQLLSHIVCFNKIEMMVVPVQQGQGKLLYPCPWYSLCATTFLLISLYLDNS